MERVKNNTNYIFTFGYTGVGKSTLLAAITRYLILHDKANLLPNSSRNPEGYKTLLKWLSQIGKCEFPERTRIGEIVQVEAAIDFGDKLVPLTLLEMSGEDLRKIDQTKDYEDGESVGLKSDFEKFVKSSDLFLLLTTAARAKEDDLLIFQFLNKLVNYKITAPTCLVITQWDKYDGSNNIEDFIQNEMELTSSQLRKGVLNVANVFKFSVGDVNGQSIENLDLSYCEPIASWLSEAIFD